jgi:hypothetical protein
MVRWGAFQAAHGAEMAAQSEVFGGEGGAKRAEALQLRVVEHNILVAAQYYSRLRLGRLAELLDLPAAEARCRCHCSSGAALRCAALRLLPLRRSPVRRLQPAAGRCLTPHTQPFPATRTQHSPARTR